MHLLHVTDTHLGVDRWYRGAPPGWRRSSDHLRAFREALAPALADEVDVVVHTGDLFDRSQPPGRAIADAEALLAEVGRHCPVVVMPGNHDRRGLRGHFLAPPGVTIVDRPEQLTVAGLRLAMVPYLATADVWAAAASVACRGGVDLLCAHQSFHGARVPGFTFRVGFHAETVGAAHIPPGVFDVLCGHIHPRQVLQVGEARVVMPGSTERTSFDERAETKGAAVWEVARGWRWLDVASRPMYVVKSEADVAAVPAEGLVHLSGAARTVDIEQAVLARGGWVAAWAAPTAQLSLFAPAR